MDLIFYLHHPSQFHLFRKAILHFRSSHQVTVLATKKDRLEDLLRENGIDYINVLPNGRGKGLLNIALSLLKQDWRLFRICLRSRPDLLVGTSTEITHIGWLLHIHSLFFVEDDVSVIPLVGKIAYPFAKEIVSPRVCDNGKWQAKTVVYDGYQKLAYLHPSVFVPDKNIADKYTAGATRYFIIRISALTAHHDRGQQGISRELLSDLVRLLTKEGRVLVSSEAELPAEFQSLFVSTAASDFHHLLAYADLYIGDSQSVAVEAALLGVPGIRVSSFSGRIGVLNELEDRYKLTRSFSLGANQKILACVQDLLSGAAKKEFGDRRKQMLSEKVNVEDFIISLINARLSGKEQKKNK